MKTFERLESQVRSYSRSFPTVFSKAKGAVLVDERGHEYIDLFAGAGALNYGHNNPVLKSRLLEYLMADGVTHSLDMATTAKRAFLETFEDVVLRPRKLSYRVMFPGPTGTNSVEAALKLARKVTGRSNVVAFTNAFHGMTLGALALTGNECKRAGAGVGLQDITRIPFDGYLGEDVDTVEILERLTADASSGIEAPAAVIVETIQAEGGINVASHEWLRRLEAFTRETGALLIVDDIQVGCGRTGTFFSFEEARIVPDIVCLSKSLSGYGLPLSVVLIRPELDQWDPGEHNGTFRGNNPAFVTAQGALEHYWRSADIQMQVAQKAELVRGRLEEICARHGGEVRGAGLIQGIEFDDPSAAGEVSRAAFERGVLLETSGASGQVAKVLPPLTISADELERGLEVVADCAAAVLRRSASRAAKVAAAAPAEATA